MGKSYGISEIAKDLGVSRQRVHQKVKKCQNPYIKYTTPGGRPRNSTVKIEMVSFYGWVCPNCQTSHKIQEKKLCDRRVYCPRCRESFHLQAQIEKKP